MRGDPPSDVYRTSAVHIQQHETIEFLKIGDPPSDVKSIDPQSDPPCDVYVTSRWIRYLSQKKLF